MPLAARAPIKSPRSRDGGCVPSYSCPIFVKTVVQTTAVAIQPDKGSRDAQYSGSQAVA